MRRLLFCQRRFGLFCQLLGNSVGQLLFELLRNLLGKLLGRCVDGGQFQLRTGPQLLSLIHISEPTRRS